MDNKDFYPTPASLVIKMTSDIDYTIKTILEPSAGKGDLISNINTSSDFNRHKKDIDVIEIEPELQGILIAKKYNLVHDDFLTFNTEKKYDLILANFPFSDGDLHMLKAINLQEKYGGKITALVNAETIRNPFSTTRKLLQDKIEQYEGTVDYLENEFTTAERKTNVEVALVRITIPEVKTKSIFIEHLKNVEYDTYNKYEQTQIVSNNPIDALVTRYNFESKIGVNLINEYEKIKPLISSSLKNSTPIISLSVSNGNSTDDRINYLEKLRGKYWHLFLSTEEIRGKYTSNVIESLNAKIDELEKKDFTKFNLISLQEELNKSISGSIDETIIALFDKLSHQFSYNKSDYEKNVHMFNGWKTNKSWKINDKVIVPINGYQTYSYSSKKELDYYYVTKQINDIVKALKYLDGNSEQFDCANLIQEIKSDVSKHKNIELPYINITFYKKGTCHIVFRDKKLLDKFNIFGSQKKGWLPPSYGKKSYQEMDKEEKDIIDVFQGENEYEKILLEKDYYLSGNEQLLLN